MKSEQIRWGIIGCGQVAEYKSGPAFNRVKNSKLLAVMRRNGERAKDFAYRHQVPLWYDKAEDLFANDKIDAVYVATPPSSHLDYALKSLEVGKHVYLEKPMVLSPKEGKILVDAVKKSDSKLVVAHYRRALPMYTKIRYWLSQEKIGKVESVSLSFLKRNDFGAGQSWRLNPSISGGGLFHDLAPHQIDLMYHFFGGIRNLKGSSARTSEEHNVCDQVQGDIGFESGVQFRGCWNFNAAKNQEKDRCEINGSQGSIVFPFYGNTVKVKLGIQSEVFEFEDPKHIQQPFIEQTVNYFLGMVKENPCSVDEGRLVTKIMYEFTKN
ncbi:MAG: Gfo/Idh/MocA family oxidoreductase [Bacteroidota bacterium]